ncbi:serine hydrolase [Antarcticibacterium flavum]|uniref:beta-N-acetylhexosaminidase n=1 Tax=Antarcticibacterium flavum TaxID=2058175 RepID=A0A5B7X2W0_9FLAO|nr:MULTISPECIES: glycoside hydrolase family 3 N-terminal domain-containing protein [Antarcticibacterium]MCM4160105.1 serine hydrolase [Antarcticibacterium sp. W02-3]QCY69659.1 serine hydrolase [Antarcticibacterium flavum]
MKKLPWLLLILLICNHQLIAQSTETKTPEFLKYEHHKWVDSIMETLSPDERISQLIMVAAYSNRGEEHRQEILKLIREQKIGGLIFFQGGPVRQVRLMNEYQAASKVPLLGAIDAEWGLGMRLDTTISYPFQMTLGAIQDESLIYDMGAEVARQIKRTGLHLNFAPVLDVNNNPNNPVINFRSFGEDKYNVTSKSIAYMRGMQDNSLLTTAKHFPGHGDTDTDSHYALPQINHDRARLDSLELYPFREVVKAGIGGVMVAHLDIPALDSTGVPSTLSRPIITNLLKEELGFKGLTVTDAMNMKGVTDGNEPGVVDKDAILAGNDLLEFTEDVPKAIAEIRKAINQGLISQEEIDRRCRKILAVKYWVGLKDFEPTSLENIIEELNTPDANLLNRKLTEASLTVLKNKLNILPLRQLSNLRIASVSIGAEEVTPFQKTLSLYTGIEHFNLKNDASPEEITVVKAKLLDYNLVIAGIHDDSKFPRNTIKMTAEVQEFLRELIEQKVTLVSLFKNPYVMDKLQNIEDATGLILTYQDSRNAQELAAQVIFGGVGATGKLPVSVGEKFKAGEGLPVQGGIRLSYTLPEEVGMDSGILNKRIDSLMQQAINAKAIPGGEVLAARKGKVFFHKAYGEHVYHDTLKVKKEDLYDLASVTKISASMAALMKLHDAGKFELDQTLASHLPSFRRSNKADIPYHDILTHQAGFKPWIPFWKNTRRKNGSYRWFTIKKDSSAKYPIKITEEMYLHRNYPDKIVKEIRKSPVSGEKKYVYSDFFFILAPRVVESMTEPDFADYLQQNFYDPLGATTLGFNPEFPKDRIVPTENDYKFRREPIHGTVHDEGAIMLGGVSGHAGLFSNANDLAKLLQMYLNKGEYGGERYLSAGTIEKFTKRTFPDSDNHRALGFDKPNYNEEGISRNTAQDASLASYGHTGFTGIMVWMDPEEDLLYIFLSNRVAPTRDNSRLYRLNTRTNIHQVIYDAILD